MELNWRNATSRNGGRSTKTLSSMLEGAFSARMDVSSEGEIRWVSSKASALFDLPPDKDVIGKKISELAGPYPS